MPIREYLCLDCGHQQENFERTQEDALTECSHCESKRMERLFTSHGGYSMSSGPASTRPRNAGAFSGRRKTK